MAGGAFAHATSSVSELAAVLQRHAPAFFRDQDRQFFQVCTYVVGVGVEGVVLRWVR